MKSILFEPFYGYHRSLLLLNGLTVKTVPIDLTNFTIDLNQLAACLTTKTKGIVVCTPNNPTGKVFTRDELMAIGELAKQHDLFCDYR